MRFILLITIICLLTVTILPSIAQSSSDERLCKIGYKVEVDGKNIICVPISDEKRTCPRGTYYGLDNQQNPVCRDIETNDIVDSTTQLIPDPTTELVNDPTTELVNDPTTELVNDPTTELVNDPTTELVNDFQTGQIFYNPWLYIVLVVTATIIIVGAKRRKPATIPTKQIPVKPSMPISDPIHYKQDSQPPSDSVKPSMPISDPIHYKQDSQPPSDSVKLPVIVVDTNVLLRYCKSRRNYKEDYKDDGRQEEIREYLYSNMDQKALYFPTAVRGEYKHIQSKPDKDSEIGVYYSRKLDDYLHNTSNESTNYKKLPKDKNLKKNQMKEMYDKITKMYQDIDADPTMKSIVDNWKNKKWESRKKKKGDQGIPPDLSNPDDSAKKDREILAEAVLLADKNSDKVVHLLTFDSDLFFFSKYVYDKLNVEILNGYEFFKIQNQT